MRAPVWVFGYGSLVSPDSVARTIGRAVDRSDGHHAAFLHGYGRRWNYGSIHQRGDWSGPYGEVRQGIVVSLGIEAAADERSNGAIVKVSHDELAMLDWRERDYQRTEVTDRVTVEHGEAAGRVFTYMPRRSAIDRYLAARRDRRAAVRRSYVHLVRGAFVRLGEHHLDEYSTDTPDPDVPVVDFA